MSTLKSINVIHPSSATNNIVNDASGNVAIGNNLTVAGTATIAGVAAVAVAPSTAGNVLTSTGSAWASTAPAGGGLPTPSAIGQIPFSTNGSTYAATQKVTVGTVATLISQTAVDFTGIPSWVKRITVMLNAGSTTSNTFPVIQLGTSSGIETTGYFGGVANINSIATPTSYMQVLQSGGTPSSLTWNTLYTINLFEASSNTWVGGGITLQATVYPAQSVYTKSLVGALDRIRITTTTGTDTFDAGSVNILYE
jgi:hypothetical protein